MDPAFANVLRHGPLSSPDIGSPLRQSILGRPGGRGHKPGRGGVPFKDATRLRTIADDKALDRESLGGDVEGSRGEMTEGLKHVEGQTPSLDEVHHPQRMSEFEPLTSANTTGVHDLNSVDTGRLPYTSPNQQATISARSATFFSSTNITIYGGSFRLNVINELDPANMASNSTDRNPQETRIKQSDLKVSDELLGENHLESYIMRMLTIPVVCRNWIVWNCCVSGFVPRPTGCSKEAAPRLHYPSRTRGVHFATIRQPSQRNTVLLPRSTREFLVHRHRAVFSFISRHHRET